jgi:hypothetical protein
MSFVLFHGFNMGGDAWPLLCFFVKWCKKQIHIFCSLYLTGIFYNFHPNKGGVHDSFQCRGVAFIPYRDYMPHVCTCEKEDTRSVWR